MKEVYYIKSIGLRKTLELLSLDKTGGIMKPTRKRDSKKQR
jgi:hypothetical protein